MLRSSFSHSPTLEAAALALRVVGAGLGLIGSVATIILLCVIGGIAAEPGPHASSFSKTHIAFATPAGDPIGALIERGR